MLLDFYFSDSSVLAGDLYFRTAPEGSPAVVGQLTGVCEGELAASETNLFFLTREEDLDPPASHVRSGAAMARPPVRLPSLLLSRICAMIVPRICSPSMSGYL